MEEVTETAAQDYTETAAPEPIETKVETPAETPVVKQETTAEASTPEAKEEPAIAPSGAPEAYADFAVPEGFNAPIDEFKVWAKNNNMTQEAAQSAVDFYTNTIAPQQETQRQAQVEVWTQQSKSKYGAKGIEAANKALGRFSTPEFTSFLTETGLGNHPEMVGIFNNISKKISESGWVNGSQGKGEKSAAQLLFGTVDKKEE